MSIAGNSIGIDYHDRALQVTVLEEAGEELGTRRCGNDAEEVIRYVKQFGAVKGCAIEACTGAANFSDELMAKSGWIVKMCHPGYVQRMRHNPDKYDKADAELLSDLHRVGYLPEVWLAPASLRDARTLMRYRASLVEERRAVKLRVGALLRAERVKLPSRNLWSKRMQEWVKAFTFDRPETQWVFKRLLSRFEELSRRLVECEKRIAQWGKNDVIVQRLLEERGVGLVTAALMRAEIGTFTRFRTGKQLSRYCGVTPRNASSGQRQADAGLIKAGNRLLRATLIQVGHNQRRYTPEWKKLSARLAGNGKCPCVIIAAIVNRWLRRLYHEMVAFECRQPQVAAA